MPLKWAFLEEVNARETFFKKITPKTGFNQKRKISSKREKIGKRRVFFRLDGKIFIELMKCFAFENLNCFEAWFLQEEVFFFINGLVKFFFV